MSWKEKVRELAAAGEVAVTRSGNVLLRAGARSVTLVRGSRVTKEGAYYREHTGNDPRINILPNAVARRLGRSEYIATRTGDRVLRVWDVVRGVWKNTALGRQYYNTARTQVVVHIPTIVRGRRKNGSTYEIAGTMPAEIEGLVDGQGTQGRNHVP